MKRFMIIAVMLLAAGLCLAQSDNEPTDSIRVTVEVQNAGSQDASLTVTTEPGTTDSTVTVSINSGPRQGKRPPRRGQWVLGCRMPNLEFKNFPGTVFLQRRVHRSGFVGMGFRYTTDQQGPAVSYARHDSSVTRNSWRQWSFALYPEYVMTRGTGSWIGSVTFRGIYTYQKSRMSSSSTDTGQTYSSRNESTSNERTTSYGIEVPFAIERRFRIGNMVFSAGLSGQFISALARKSSQESTSSFVYTSTYGGTTTYSNQSHAKQKDPLRLVIDSPFNGPASIQLKYWF